MRQAIADKIDYLDYHASIGAKRYKGKPIKSEIKRLARILHFSSDPDGKEDLTDYYNDGEAIKVETIQGTIIQF